MTDLAKLAAMLSAGLITEDAIRETFGDSVCSRVLGFGAAGLAAGLAGDIVDEIGDFFDF